MIHIETAANGWILTESFEDEDDTVEVFQDDDYTDLGSAKSVQALLQAVQEHLGETGSKHDAFMVRVVVQARGEDVTSF